MAETDVIQVRGRWYSKTTRRFLGPVVEGEAPPTGGLKPVNDLTEGSVADVLERLSGDDVTVAQVTKALDQEKAKEEPRKSLVKELESMLSVDVEDDTE